MDLSIFDKYQGWSSDHSKAFLQKYVTSFSNIQESYSNYGGYWDITDIDLELNEEAINKLTEKKLLAYFNEFILEHQYDTIEEWIDFTSECTEFEDLIFEQNIPFSKYPKGFLKELIVSLLNSIVCFDTKYGNSYDCDLRGNTLKLDLC